MASDAVERLLGAAKALPEPLSYSHERGYRCVYCERSDTRVNYVDHDPDCQWRQLREAAVAVQQSEARDVWVVDTESTNTGRQYMYAYLEDDRAWDMAFDRRSSGEPTRLTHYRAYPVTESEPS